MITIRSIPVHDGKLTEAGEDLCAQVYEAITGEVKHELLRYEVVPPDEVTSDGYVVKLIRMVCTCGWEGYSNVNIG